MRGAGIDAFSPVGTPWAEPLHPEYPQWAEGAHQCALMAFPPVLRLTAHSQTPFLTFKPCHSLMERWSQEQQKSARAQS